MDDIAHKVKMYVDGALPLLSAILDKINFVQRIDNQINQNQENRIISTGNAIKSMGKEKPIHPQEFQY
ncbi:MAG: DUF4277 domain-containing protein [Tepidibacter sp.]|jgi:cell fate (sporulation/competence/biofilm development) regulator YmcA (YheA/YmcA/DUF963 family)|uniref:hypothetical protein n=1 Tax=Tepidibacter sp. TaxID=2529387 RepID=UPI0025F411CC|nr:hypothetical protein [Tepidibacter sp.]MCT4509591.1 DUF4277 domain-containing protein [Tepidibacter sp.]